MRHEITSHRAHDEGRTPLGAERGLEPLHGWGIAQRIEQLSRERFRVNQGSLYPALQRLKRQGLIRSEWRTTEHNRRARFYLLTVAGRVRLEEEQRDWERSAAAVGWILSATLEEVRS
jgi:PadR family transcriptional regulator PadR